MTRDWEVLQQEILRHERYLRRILELAEGAEGMRHDAAIAHLQAITKLAKEAKDGE